ncbi:MAG: hypothetical protein ACRDYV_13645 [Acidimicrobiia bacterium]
MSRDELEARLLATEIALDALLAEVEELQFRLDEHARDCRGGEIQLP